MDFTGLEKVDDPKSPVSEDQLDYLEPLGPQRPKFHPGRLVGAGMEGFKDWARRKAAFARSHLQMTAPDEEWREYMDSLGLEREIEETGDKVKDMWRRDMYQLNRAWSKSWSQWRDLLMVENPELAGEVQALIDTGIDPETAKHRVTDDFIEKRHRRNLDFAKSIEESEFLETAPEFAGQSSGAAEDVIRSLAGSSIDTLSLMVSPWIGVPMVYTSIAGALTEQIEGQAEQMEIELDRDRIYKAATFGSLASLPLELIGNLFQIRAITGTGPWTSRLMALGQAFMGEASTELLQTYPETVALTWALNPDLTGDELLEHIQDVVFSDKTAREALYSAWIGGWASAGMGGAGQTVVGLGSFLISPKQQRIVEDRAARVKEYMRTEELTSDQQKEFLRLVGMDPEVIEDAEISEIVERVKARILFQGEPIKSESRNELINQLEGGNLPQDIRELYLSIWDGMARVAADEGLISKPEHFYDQWISQVRLSKLSEFEREQLLYQVPAWHGTGAIFDQFTTKYVGSAGGTSFGWGLYFTEVENIARHYAQEEARYSKEDKQKISDRAIKSIEDRGPGYLSPSEMDIVKRDLGHWISGKNPITPLWLGGQPYNIDLSRIIENLYQRGKISKGRVLYRAILHKGKDPSEYTWLDWYEQVDDGLIDKINKQLEKEHKFRIPVHEIVAGFGTGRDIYNILMERYGNKKDASLFLLRAGIDGIRYPTGTLSGITDSKDFNYVVFDENAVTIDERILYQQPAPAPEVDFKKPTQLELDFKPVEIAKKFKIKRPEQKVRAVMRTTGNIKAAGHKATSIDDAANLMASIRKSAQELAYTVAVDAEGNILEIHRYGKGTRGSASIDHIEVAGRILNVPEVARAYFLHNHPSGKTDPSKEDANVHRTMAHILGLKKIPLESAIIAGTAWRAFDFSGPISLATPLEPQLRKEDLPVKERHLILTPEFKDTWSAQSSQEVIEYLQKNRKIEKDGIVFFNAQNQIVGWMPWPAGKESPTASAEIIRFIESTNARAFVVNFVDPMTPSKERTDYLVDVARSLFSLGVQMHDIIADEVSMRDTTGKQFDNLQIAIAEPFKPWEPSAEPGLIVKQDRRGAVQYLFDNTPKIIHLFESADVSTALHETGHILLEMMYRAGSLDYLEASKWVGVEEDRARQGTDSWNDAELEKFAKGFELYLIEGRAPTMRLQQVFAKLRKMLVAIYKAIANKYFSDVKLNEDMRRLFDRWVATEQERVMDPVFEVAEWLKAGDLELSKADRIKAEEERRALHPGSVVEMEYDDLVATARKAVGVELARRKGEMEKKLERQFRKEAEDSIADEPFYAMLDEIKAAGGLRWDSVRRLFDPNLMQDLIRKRPGMISRIGGIEPDVVGMQYGYDTGDEVLQDMLYRPTKKEAIEEYYNSLWREYEASEHLNHANAYADSLEVEIDLLNQLLGRKKPQIRRDLKKIIRAKTGQIRTPDSRKLAADLRRDAQVARDAWRAAKKAARDEFDTQISEEKRAIARKEKGRALDKIARLRLDHLAKIQALRDHYKRNREKEKIHKRMGRAIRHKSMLPEFKSHIINVLGRYYKIPKTWQIDPPAETLEQFVEGLEADGEQLDIIRMLLTKLPPPKSKGKLLAEDIQNIGDLVDALVHIERTERRQQLIDQKRKFDAVVDGLVDEIYDTHKPGVEQVHPLNVDERIGFLKGMSESAKAYFAQLKKAEFIFRALDGWKDLGKNWSDLFQPIKAAEDAELEMMEEHTKQLQEAFKGFDRKWANRLYKITGIADPITKEKMIMLMLNAGNRGNREAIKAGNGATQEILDEIANRLTQKEVKLVYDIWSIIDSLFPQLNETHKKLTGVNLRKVEGKYFPLVFSRKLSWTAGEHQARREMRDLFASAYVRPKVEAGHRIERKGGKMGVDLRFDVIANHIQGVIHDITHQVPVRNTQKILFNEKYRAAVGAALGEDAYKQLTPWLQEVAKPRREPMSILEKWVGRIRRNATIVALGLKLTVAQKQTLSLTQTMDELGTLPTLAAMKQFYRNPWALRRFVNERSPSIKNRRKAWDRELSQFYGSFNPREWRGATALKEGYFSLISLMDAIATYPTWLAGYNVGMKRFDGHEKRAIEYADMVVRRTQPVARAKDLADIQRGGELKKTLTMFYTFFNVFQNRMMELHARRRSGRVNMVEMLKSYWLLMILPGILGTLINKREWDTEEVIKGLVSYSIGGMPGFRDLGQGILSDWGYTMTPVAQFGQEVAYVGKSLEAGKFEKLPKHMIYVSGYLVGLPAAQITIALDGLVDMAEGKTSNPMRLLFREKKEKD